MKENPAGLQPVTPGSAALALLCAMLWGGVAVSIRFTLEDIPPLGIAWIRFAISVPFLVVWFKIRGHSLAPRREEMPTILLVAFLLFAQIGTFHGGLGHTNAAHASLIIGSHPVFVAVIAHFTLRGERLAARMVLGLVLAVAGLVVLVSGEQAAIAGTPAEDRDPITILGDALILASSVILGAKISYSKHVLARIDVGRFLVWSHILGTLILCGASGYLEGFETYRFSARAIAGVTYMGVIISFFCFAAWTLLLKKHPAGQLEAFAFAQPAFGILMGVLLRGDPLTVWFAAGAAGVGVGIAIVTSTGNRRRTEDGTPRTYP